MSQQDTAQIALLKKHFANCFDKHGNFIAAKLQEIVQDSGTALSKEGYSLNWLGKSYARLLANEAIRTRLVANTAHNAKPDHAASQNLLIKGDNLDVLKHLMDAYSEQVKMIYIDPPYNTGSDGFVYQDDRKFTAPQLSDLAGIDEAEARRILEFTQAKSNNHSAWLTFMYPRLYLARQLLRDDGVIFISIDDNEQAQLKILCDEVFGEENFVSSIMWKRKKEVSSDSRNVAIQGEFIVAYSKSGGMEFRPETLSKEYVENSYYEPTEVFPLGKWRPVPLTVSKGLNGGGYEYTITTPNGNEHHRLWAYPQKSFNKLLANKLVYFGKDGSGIPQRVIYAHESNGQPTSNYWDNTATNKEGKKEVLSIFTANCFDTPKPIKLIQRLINLVINEDDIILDFFAGSGTTAHAVMQLNAEDGGNRRFICVQIAEATDPKSEAHKAGYPTIFDITQARIEKAASKIKADLEKSVTVIPAKSLPSNALVGGVIQVELNMSTKMDSRLRGNDGVDGCGNDEVKECGNDGVKKFGSEANARELDLGFKIFETLPMFDRYLDAADELTENLELFDAKTLNQQDRQSLLLTWAVRDGIKLGAALEPVALDGYTAYAAGKILYFIEPNLTLDAVIAVLEQLDNNPAFAPSRLVVWGWGLDSKIQREMTEAVMGYNNRKGIALTLDIRFN